MSQTEGWILNCMISYLDPVHQQKQNTEREKILDTEIYFSLFLFFWKLNYQKREKKNK